MPPVCLTGVSPPVVSRLNKKGVIKHSNDAWMIFKYLHLASPKKIKNKSLTSDRMRRGAGGGRKMPCMIQPDRRNGAQNIWTKKTHSSPANWRLSFNEPPQLKKAKGRLRCLGGNAWLRLTKEPICIFMIIFYLFFKNGTYGICWQKKSPIFSDLYEMLQDGTKFSKSHFELRSEYVHERRWHFLTHIQIRDVPILFLFYLFIIIFCSNLILTDLPIQNTSAMEWRRSVTLMYEPNLFFNKTAFYVFTLYHSVFRTFLS